MWLAYAKAGKEFEVQQALAGIDVTAHCARQVEAKRVGKRRRPDIFIEPLLPNYIFIDCAVEEYLDVVAIKHLASTMSIIPTADQRSVRRFLDVAEGEFTDRMARIEAGERVDEFKLGDVLQVLDGPLSGLTATFKRILEGDRGVFPSVVAEVKLMGQSVEAKLDVLDVRKAS